MSTPRIFEDIPEVKEILKNLEMLNDIKNEKKLIVLEKVVAEKNSRAEQVVIRILSTIGWSRPTQFSAKLLTRLMKVMSDADFLSLKRLNTLYNNALFFANHSLIKVLYENGFISHPEYYQKAEAKYLSELNEGRNAKKYLQVCKVFFELKLRDILQQIKDKIKTYPFAINYGGDSSIVEIGHAVPTHAAQLFNLANEALKSEESLLDTYQHLSTQMISKLRDQNIGWFTKAGLGSLFGNFGVTAGKRDESTSGGR